MGANQKHRVDLSKTDREYLETYLRAGTHSSRMLNRVRILLFADKGEFGPSWQDKKVSEAVGVSLYTLYGTYGKDIVRRD